LTTFNSRTNGTSAAPEPSIIDRSSSNCPSMNEDGLAGARMRIL
jgi:hypothetical protein